MKNPLFYAKILLFGEYAIIKNAKALAIPYNFYEGVLVKNVTNPTEFQKDSCLKLQSFARYLKELDTDLVKFDFVTMQRDLQSGMYFDSNIPQGYGVGSSGALVAAVYEQYALDKMTDVDLSQEKLLHLKEIFALMEHFFHGVSSGLDPLNSYLGLPVLMHSKDSLEATSVPLEKQGKAAIFLLDSQSVGQTQSMVEVFMNKMKTQGFRRVFRDKFSEYTNACVAHFLKGDVKELFTDVRQLSKIVLNHFQQMIPDPFQDVWRKGIETDNYYLKLCGSGGGGYLLGFAPDFEKAKEQLKEHRLELVYRF